jgi:hypothetical protein
MTVSLITKNKYHITERSNGDRWPSAECHWVKGVIESTLSQGCLSPKCLLIRDICDSGMSGMSVSQGCLGCLWARDVCQSGMSVSHGYLWVRVGLWVRTICISISPTPPLTSTPCPERIAVIQPMFGSVPPPPIPHSWWTLCAPDHPSFLPLSDEQPITPTSTVCSTQCPPFRPSHSHSHQT